MKTKTETAPREVITTAEAAKLLGVYQRRVARLLDSGTLAEAPRPGRDRLVYRDSVEQLKAAKTLTRRKTKPLTIDGKTKTMAQWSKATGIKLQTLLWRRANGFKGKAIIAPVKE